MECTGLTVGGFTQPLVGGFTQPLVAGTLIEQPSSAEKDYAMPTFLVGIPKARVCKVCYTGTCKFKVYRSNR